MATDYSQIQLSLGAGETKEPRLNQIKVVALGDSLTFGFPYTPFDSWVYLVQERIGVTFYNKGINGDVTGQMLARFSRDCLTHNPSHVIITGGSNDVFYEEEVDEILKNITAMVETALKNNIKPIIGLAPPLNFAPAEKVLEICREKMKKLALQKNIGIINFPEAFLASNARIKTELFADDAHPNREGYKAMAAVAFEALKDLANT